MIDLQRYKLQNYDLPYQLILMNTSGKIVQSCNSLFDTYKYQSQLIIKEIPFLDSMFQVIKNRISSSSEIVFQKVEQPSSLLQGIYDFTFSMQKVDNQLLILWTILDKTLPYNQLFKIQQYRNESEIKRQLKNVVY
ncbi:MAG: hypothetical protein AB8G11_15610 [Saprospiraceae bacterium]